MQALQPGDAVRAAIQAACAAAGRTLQLLEVRQPGQLQALARQAVQAAQADGGVVVAVGGDGTLNAVAQAVLGSGCAFGVLPQGTFNYFSRTHGIPSDTGEALRVLLTDQPQPVQVGLVNGRVFLVNASLGLYPRLLHDREAWKQQLGRHRLVALGADGRPAAGGAAPQTLLTYSLDLKINKVPELLTMNILLDHLPKVVRAVQQRLERGS